MKIESNRESQKLSAVVVKEGKNRQVLHVSESEKGIPIFNLRDFSDQVEAARLVAQGKRMAMYGGVWGGFRAVKRWDFAERFFHEVKVGRPEEAKIPLMTLPENAVRIIDWSMVHEDFRFLEHYWNFKKLWENHGAFLHIIAPARETLKSLAPIFVTSAEEFMRRYPNSTPVSSPTIAGVWRDDPYLRHFATLIGRFSHTDMYIGVSTLNPHGEEPPYTFEEFKKDLSAGRIPAESVDLIVKDDSYERYQAFSSHTQIRLPFVGENPVLRVLRIGSLSPEGFGNATGFNCVIEKDAKDVRKNKGENLDAKLKAMIDEIWAEYGKQKPLIVVRE